MPGEWRSALELFTAMTLWRMGTLQTNGAQGENPILGPPVVAFLTPFLGGRVY